MYEMAVTYSGEILPDQQALYRVYSQGNARSVPPKVSYEKFESLNIVSLFFQGY